MNERERQLDSLLTDAVAHDLRNLLFVLDANLDLVSRQPDLPEAVQPSLATMMRATGQGKLLVDCLMSLSGRAGDAPETVPLREVVQAVALLAQKVLPPNLQIKCETGNAQLLVCVSKSALLRALFELVFYVREAADGMADERLLHLRLCEPSPDATGGQVSLSIVPPLPIDVNPSSGSFARTEAFAKSIGGHFTQSCAADATTFSIVFPRFI